MVEIAQQLYELLNKGGLMVGLLLAVLALATERIVPGPRYQAALKRIADLEFRLDRQMSTTDKAIDATEYVARTRGHPEEQR